MFRKVDSLSSSGVSRGKDPSHMLLLESLIGPIILNLIDTFTYVQVLTIDLNILYY